MLSFFPKVLHLENHFGKQFIYQEYILGINHWQSILLQMVRSLLSLYTRRFALFGTICTIKKREKHPWKSVTIS